MIPSLNNIQVNFNTLMSFLLQFELLINKVYIDTEKVQFLNQYFSLNTPRKGENMYQKIKTNYKTINKLKNVPTYKIYKPNKNFLNL